MMVRLKGATLKDRSRREQLRLMRLRVKTTLSVATRYA